MKRFSFFALVLLILVGCKQQAVDLIVHNAKIYTVDSLFTITEAMAVKDGLVVSTGDSKSILKSYKSDQTIDAKQQAIYPGFTDAHCHFWGYAQHLRSVDLRGTRSLNEVLEKLKQHAEDFSSEWITGRGWDQNDWDIQAFPTNKLLDEFFPDKAVVLTRVDGHAVLANSTAIKLSNIVIDDYPSEMIIRENNKSTGVFLEAAGDIIKQAVPQPTEEEMLALLKQAEQNCFEVGLTKVYDAGLDLEAYQFLKQLYDNKQLKIGFDFWISANEHNLSLIKQGPKRDGDLTVSTVKLYADGALGSRGACLIKPYSDAKTSGVIVESIDFFRKWCQIAYDNNLQVATHCIGDSANRLMLNIYGEVLKGKNDKRWRIEHAQVVDAADIKKFAQFSIHPSVQPTHCTSDMYWAGERLGARIKDGYRYKTLLQQNGWLAAGSDFPVEDVNPLFGFHAAVTRQDKKGWPENGFQATEALSREQALRAMTIWAAKSNFSEARSGSLEKGKIADFVMLKTDIMTSQAGKLWDVAVDKTFKRGQLVYTKAE